MDWTQTLFWFFFAMTIGSAVFVVTVRNLVHAAFWLMITLFCVAALYVFLKADFLAATQVVVYVGGILVLVLFGVMMTSGKLDLNLKLERGQMISSGIISIALLAILFLIVRRTNWQTAETQFDSEGTTSSIGEAIMGEFLLPFEVVSIVLLIALIGAVLITRKEVKKEDAA
ncbi:MAG: NADH-quinone oxidoreductase subunit J [Candidatus Poribacteria bacterium]|jgi:NADH-quinone oxidoreductase subunit J|nr:NADH-quinone oxidoreductase subunit J [Candidatus Poribacteria bacterium]MDP6746970.1 NADH-quinone oxidoreductase subunit J [Candidatus Poribacteria bacterium]MDP6997488.1 NADH-quinone oxidoreductase subunit J [Candidatus Poribacteria bacterium]